MRVEDGALHWPEFGIDIEAEMPNPPCATRQSLIPNQLLSLGQSIWSYEVSVIIFSKAFFERPCDSAVRHFTNQEPERFRRYLLHPCLKRAIKMLRFVCPRSGF